MAGGGGDGAAGLCRGRRTLRRELPVMLQRRGYGRSVEGGGGRGAADSSINQSKRKTSNANGQTNLGHKHKAPDHNHEATQPMVDLPHTS